MLSVSASGPPIGLVCFLEKRYALLGWRFGSLFGEYTSDNILSSEYQDMSFCESSKCGLARNMSFYKIVL